VGSQEERGPNEAMLMNAWLITATSSSLPIALARQVEEQVPRSGAGTYPQEPMDRKRPAGGCGDSRADGRPRFGSRRPTPHEKTAVAVPATASRGRRRGVRGGLSAGSRTRAHYRVWLETLRRKGTSRAFELGTRVRESEDRPADNWIRRCRPPWRRRSVLPSDWCVLEVSCPQSS
jgi:hypothetical protein